MSPEITKTMDDDNLDKNKKLFPQKLWELIHDERYQSCLRWSEDGHRVYLNREDFEESYLKKPDQNQFNTQKAISFVRQMNMYGFKKVDDFYYENENFKRDSPDSLKRMIRRHPARNSDFITQEPLNNNDYEISTNNNFLKANNNNNTNNNNNSVFINTNNNNNNNNNNTKLINNKDNQDTQETDYTLNHCSPTRSPTSPIPSATNTTNLGPYTQSNDSLVRVGHYDSISPQNMGTDEEIMQRGHWTLPQDKSMCTAEEVRRGQRINGVARNKCPIIGCNKRVSPTNIYPALISHLYGYHFSGFNSYSRYHNPKYCRLIHNNSWNDRLEEMHTVHDNISHHQNPTNLSSHDSYGFMNTCTNNNDNNNIDPGNMHGSDEDLEHNNREDISDNSGGHNDDGDDHYQEDSLNSYSPTLSNLRKRHLIQTHSSSPCSPSKMLKHQRQLLQQHQQHQQLQHQLQQQPQDLSNHSHQNQRLKANLQKSPNSQNYDDGTFGSSGQTGSVCQSSFLPSPQIDSIASQLVKKISEQREVKLDSGASIEAEKFAEKLLFTLIDDAAMIVEHQNESRSPPLDKNNKEMLIDASSLTLALKFMPSRLAAALSEKSITQINHT